jgi:very-short-patch-repair endonuclease
MLHGPKQTQRFARNLRSEMTLPEVLLWRALRERPAGLKFRRQHPAGPYVLDFFCAQKRLAIETDGEAHNRGDRLERDRVRDIWLAEQGVRVLRIRAVDVLADVEAVVRHIVTIARGELPLHQPAAGPPPPPGEDV